MRNAKDIFREASEKANMLRLVINVCETALLRTKPPSTVLVPPHAHTRHLLLPKPVRLFRNLK